MGTKDLRPGTGDETARINRFALIILTVIDSFLVVGYAREGVAGSIPPLFAWVFVACVLFSMAAAFGVYLKNHESGILKHVVMIGYGIVYAMAIMGARNDYVFVMAFPVAVVFILYFDVAFVVRASVIVMLLNVIYAVRFYIIKGQMPSGAPVEMASVLLHLASGI